MSNIKSRITIECEVDTYEQVDRCFKYNEPHKYVQSKNKIKIEYDTFDQPSDENSMIKLNDMFILIDDIQNCLSDIRNHGYNGLNGMIKVNDEYVRLEEIKSCLHEIRDKITFYRTEGE